MNETTPSRRIHVLRDSVSRLIAAGEVIERPASVVRELLDNALDSGASRVELYLEGGGITRIRVIDDGCGMNREDLELCFEAHATSKIGELDDLDSLDSLGFRGEALSSIAACSKLTITSSLTGSETHSVTLHGGSLVSSGPTAGNKGTLVDVSDLFYSMPARKKFLKRPSSETNLCVNSFVEKASAFPQVAFKLVVDGKTRYTLNPEDLKTRLENLYGRDYGFREFTSSQDSFTLIFIAGNPDLPRKDRRLLQVFVQNRRVYEYALLQAIEYAYDSFTPGGYHPVCFLFISIDPSLVDFNIHPAKREVRFRNLPDLHRAVTSVLRARLYNREVSEKEYAGERDGTEGQVLFESPPSSYTPTPAHTDLLAAWSRLEPMDNLPSISRPYRYIGQAFGVFLLAEMGEDLLFIDQHAAHEKMIYNGLVKGGNGRQELLVPYQFETDTVTDRSIESKQPALEDMGITLEASSPGFWQLLAIPAGCDGREGLIAEFLAQLQGSTENLRSRLFAAIACKAAVKEGMYLDGASAQGIIDAVLAMDVPRCPHGRPIIYRINRDFLYRQVKRT